VNKSRRPATRIDLGEAGRSALRASLEGFLQEEEIELSDLKLRQLVDHMEDRAGHLFYNRAVEDLQAAVGQSFGRLQEDLDLLRKI